MAARIGDFTSIQIRPEVVQTEGTEVDQRVQSVMERVDLTSWKKLYREQCATLGLFQQILMGLSPPPNLIIDNLLTQYEQDNIPDPETLFPKLVKLASYSTDQSADTVKKGSHFDQFIAELIQIFHGHIHEDFALFIYQGHTYLRLYYNAEGHIVHFIGNGNLNYEPKEEDDFSNIIAYFADHFKDYLADFAVQDTPISANLYRRAPPKKALSRDERYSCMTGLYEELTQAEEGLSWMCLIESIKKIDPCFKELFQSFPDTYEEAKEMFEEGVVQMMYLYDLPSDCTLAKFHPNLLQMLIRLHEKYQECNQQCRVTVRTRECAGLQDSYVVTLQRIREMINNCGSYLDDRYILNKESQQFYDRLFNVKWHPEGHITFASRDELLALEEEYEDKVRFYKLSRRLYVENIPQRLTRLESAYKNLSLCQQQSPPLKNTRFFDGCVPEKTVETQERAPFCQTTICLKGRVYLVVQVLDQFRAVVLNNLILFRKQRRPDCYGAVDLNYPEDLGLFLGGQEGLKHFLSERTQGPWWEIQGLEQVSGQWGENKVDVNLLYVNWIRFSNHKIKILT